jgi:hypothetical protein
MTEEYHFSHHKEKSNSHGLFCAILNCRIFLSALNGICELKGLTVNNDLSRLSFSLRPKANSSTKKSWDKWGDENGETFYNKMTDLEADLCDMNEDPFWQGEPTELIHTGLWSLDLLANINIMVDGNEFYFYPLIMLDDMHDLEVDQQGYLFRLLTSRQIAIPFWISIRKQALGLENILAERIGKGVESGRDYQIIDFEKSGRVDFKKRVSEISTLRVQSVAAQIGGASHIFENFISDNRDDIFLNNFDQNVVQEIKKRVYAAAGSQLGRFQKIIKEVEDVCHEPHDLCRKLRTLEILIKREVGKTQNEFSFHEIPSDFLTNKAAVDAADRFLAKEYKLPYYFGASKLITLSSFNIQQFLRLAGALFDEIMTAMRLARYRDSIISEERQNSIIGKVAKEYLREIPSMVHHGNSVFGLVQAIGGMCRDETYRPTAPYAPGVTGTALSMYEFDILYKRANKGDESCLELYQTIESAVAHNILEPETNYKCKNNEFLVLYLNRLLCVPFQLPLQRGGFREQKLSTFIKWIKGKSQDDIIDGRQKNLW